MLDGNQHVALGVATMADCAIQIDSDASEAGRIVDRVKPRAAIERIGAGPAHQTVIARIAVERIIAAAAGNGVSAPAPMLNCSAAFETGQPVVALPMPIRSTSFAVSPWLPAVPSR